MKAAKLIPCNSKIFACLFFIFASVTVHAQQQWVEVETPDTSATRNMLRDISGTSSNDVWTVGSYETTTPGNMKNLVMHWNGSSWDIYNGTDLSTTLNDLWGVTAIATNNVWAAGAYNGPSYTRAQLMHWNGSAWSHTSLPDIPGGSFLDGIDAYTATDIWAVGGKVGSPTRPSYALHYNGSAWNEVTVPNVGIFRNRLYDVDCISTNDVWAVGTYGDSYGDFHAMAQHWNGSNWTNVSLPADVYSPIGELYSVTAIASDDVWALGSTITGELLMIHWNGSAWIEMPTAGGQGGAVAARGEDVFSVGGRISQWDGNSWSVIDSINQVSYPTLISTVTFSNGDIWAAGISGLEGFYTFVYRTVPQAPLAVQMSSYAVTRWDTKAVMQWSTTSEINADRFVMERSTEGTQFTMIDQVAASGSAHQYQLIDPLPLTGINYYRLKLVDLDGSVNVYPVKYLNFDTHEAKSFAVYPNPVQGDVVNISLEGEGKRMLVLYNHLGQEVKKWSVDTDVTDMQLSLPAGLASGTYIISMITGKGVRSESVMVE